MEFNKSMDWLKESNEDDNLLADDELDMVEEEMNEGLYVDPSNYDKHNDLIDVVDKAGNPQKMTQATYDKNKDSGEFEKKEPEKKKVKAGKKPEKLVPGNTYSIHKPMMISDDISMFDEKEQEIIKKNGWLNKKGEVILPKGTDVIYQERSRYDDVFQTKDGNLSFDTAISDDFSDFREKEEPIKDKVKAGKKVDKNPAPKDMSSEEIQKMTQNHTKLINDSILTKEGKNAVKDSFDKTGRVYVTFKNDYGDDIRAFWRKDDDGTIRREMFSHHKPISGNDYWSRDIEDDNEYYFNDIDEFIDEMSAELEYDENMKIYV